MACIAAVLLYRQCLIKMNSLSLSLLFLPPSLLPPALSLSLSDCETTKTFKTASHPHHNTWTLGSLRDQRWDHCSLFSIHSLFHARRSVSNLITVVSSSDSRADHASMEAVHNSRLTTAYFHTQSVCQITGEIHDFTVDNKPDALILTET